MGGDRYLIIDTGFNREECQSEMNTSLQKLGVNLDKTDIFLTHLHADHIGLVGTLATDNSRVYINETEVRQIKAQRDNWAGYWQKLLDVYVANGFPAEGAQISMKSHPAHKYGLKREVAFSAVKDGDTIEVGDFHFQCVATPGHSPGHTCLYEPNKKILVAGDHILFDITPNITYWLDMDDPLNEYLTSLEKVNTLDVEIVLPGHRRLVLAALSDGAKTTLEIAPQITWDITSKSWEEFPPAQKWFAFGETLAHVRFLENKGKVRRQSQNGKILYSLA
jgi:glyoxylase-like metal-dependent hydrolase (beta-lactamase superfamily II)